MNISTKTRYGFRLMIYLGMNEASNESIQLGEIAEKEDISLKYLEKIVQMLKRGGWVTVKRGPKGGYRLSKESRFITLLDIFETLEGSCSVIDCLEEERCDHMDKCSTANIWNGLTSVIREYLSGKTLEDVVLEHKNRNHMFYI